jgi:hypothetical protein
MLGNEKIIRELCAAAEGQGLDIEKFVSMFSHDGYMWDMASGTKFRGQAIGESIAGLASAFPDVHREIFNIHVAEDSSLSSWQSEERTKASCTFLRELLLPRAR